MFKRIKFAGGMMGIFKFYKKFYKQTRGTEGVSHGSAYFMGSRQEIREGKFAVNASVDFAFKLSLAYGKKCKPLCQELGLPQTAFDILMFLANNPVYKTASDIVEVRKIKANLVSVNVEKLVQEGYLKREAVKGDRRKTQLICTDKAQPVIRRGRTVQEEFLELLFENTDEEAKKLFFEVMDLIGKNMDKILDGGD